MSDVATAAGVLGGALAIGKPIVESTVRFLENLLGEPCKVAGEMLADQVYHWQWMNRVKIAARAKEIMNEKGIAEQLLPPGFLIPMLSSAGNVDDSHLQDLWANLLASAVAHRSHRHPAFVHILSQLNRDEAKILEYVRDAKCRLVDELDLDASRKQFFNQRVISNSFPLGNLDNPDEFAVYTTHLDSLNLTSFPVHEQIPIKDEGNPPVQTGTRRDAELLLTDFGRKFVEACTGISCITPT